MSNKLEELSKKLDDEIRQKDLAEKEDRSNYTASIFSGILGSIGGILGGIAIGFCIGLVFEIGSCISNGTEKGMNKYSGFIVITSVLIGGIVGALGGFSSKRNK